MAEAKTHRLGAALSLIPLIFLISGDEAASFQRNQLLQKEPDLRLENVQKFPSPEMIRALEYIEKLRQHLTKKKTAQTTIPTKVSLFHFRKKKMVMKVTCQKIQGIP